MAADLSSTLRYAECHEGVTRRGNYEPCEGIAVGVRMDPEEGGFYPVCSRHTRRPMVRLADIVAAAAYMQG